MTDKRLLISSLAVSLLLPLATAMPSRAALPTGFDDVVIFATNSIQLRAGSDVLSGDVVANVDSPGPTLTNPYELSVGIAATTPAGYAIKAEKLRVRFNSVVGGDAFCNALVDGSGQVTCSPLSLPVFATLPPFNQGSTGGTQYGNVFVGWGQSATLDPGDYGNITVRKNGSLLFNPGVYSINNFNGGINNTIEFAGPTELRITKRFDTDINSYVGPASGSGVGASDIVIYVAGINGWSGGLWAVPKAAQIGINNTVEANLYAPNGTLWIRQGTEATGAYLGRDVILGIGAQATLGSYFFNRPPDAMDDSETTPEDTAITIDVLANDNAGPAFELQDLTIDATSGPGAGRVEIIGGQIEYTPTPDFHGTDTFTYTACDGGDDDDTATDGDDLCDTATVTVDVTPVNDPPGAVPQDLATSGTAAIGIILTGFDPDGDVLTFSIVTPPNGAVGSLGPLVQDPPAAATTTYTPVNGDDEENSFVFQVTDPGGLTSQAEVRINPGAVDPGNPDPPDLEEVVAQDQTVEVVAGTTVTITLRANAPCELVEPPETPASPCQGFGNDVPLTFTVGTPTSGSLANLTQGSEVPQRTATVEYTPVTTGTASFTFTAAGAQPGESDTATVTVVTEAATPDGPPVAIDVGYKTMMNTEVMINLLGSPSDSQLGDCGRANPLDCPGEGGGN